MPNWRDIYADQEYEEWAIWPMDHPLHAPPPENHRMLCSDLNEELQGRVVVEKLKVKLMKDRELKLRDEMRAQEGQMNDLYKGLFDVADIVFPALRRIKSASLEDPAVKALHDGALKLKDVFEKNGIEVFWPLGEKFDGFIHDCVEKVPKEQAVFQEPGDIVKVVKVGYNVRGLTLRHPQVGVCLE